MKNITQYYIDNFVREHSDLAYLKEAIVTAVTQIVSLAPANKLLICGNGGSAADSEHIAGELLKSFNLKRPISEHLRNELHDHYGADGDYVSANLQDGVKVIPLTSFPAFATAFANDCSPDLIFAQLVHVLGIPGDILLAISTSGNSPNVLYAAKVARLKGIKVIAMTGAKGGKLKELADVLLNVPSNIVYRIQEQHLPLYHLLCLCIESELFDI